MKTQEWRNVDKSGWRDGEWKDEPDKRQWLTEAGFAGLIHRGPSGSLCGYVGVTTGHPWFENGYDDCEAAADADSYVDVHGGLTFASACQEKATPENGICHLVEDGEDANVWWLGFDCGHAGDNSPAYDVPGLDAYGTYKNIEYVTAEVERLARQAKEVADWVRP